MTREKIRRLERKAGVQRNPVEFWVETGDGFVESHRERITEAEFTRRYGDVESFTLDMDSIQAHPDE